MVATLNCLFYHNIIAFCVLSIHYNSDVFISRKYSLLLINMYNTAFDTRTIDNKFFVIKII